MTFYFLEVLEAFEKNLSLNIIFFYIVLEEEYVKDS